MDTPKRCYFTGIILSSVEMVTDKHRHMLLDKHCRRSSYGCQHRWPWM